MLLDQIHSTMVALAPLYALIVAQQRSGLARPYTINPSKEAQVVQAIEDGSAAFDAG